MNNQKLPNNRVGIVWISTGLYTARFSDFIKSCEDHFLPGVEKFYYIFSDKPKVQLQRLENAGIDSSRYHIQYIEHLCWPIVTLFKMKRVLNAARASLSKDACDYIFYFNSNIKFLSDVTPDEVLFDDKITAVHNPAWWIEGEDHLKFTYGRPLDPKFKCHIDGDYDYLQAAMYGGPVKLIFDMSLEQYKSMEYDLAHRRIPCWDDESYFNWWCAMNKDKVNILPRGFFSDEVRMEEYGDDKRNCKIVMTNSDDTQFAYKDIFFTNI